MGRSIKEPALHRSSTDACAALSQGMYSRRSMVCCSRVQSSLSSLKMPPPCQMSNAPKCIGRSIQEPALQANQHGRLLETLIAHRVHHRPQSWQPAFLVGYLPVSLGCPCQRKARSRWVEDLGARQALVGSLSYAPPQRLQNTQCCAPG